MDQGSGIREVHRPESLEEAVRLLSRADVPTVPLFVSPRPPETPPSGAVAAVDLSRLGLDGVHATGGGITLGSAATLEAVLKSPIGRTPPGAFLQEACRTTAHSGLRAVASVGGALVSGEPSDLLLGLLALDAVCVVRGSRPREVPLVDFSPASGELLTEVKVLAPRGAQGLALERVARTPRDRSVVAAAAALELHRGVCATVRLALAGVAPKALRWPAAEMLVEGQEVTAQRIGQAAALLAAEARPVGDHLGSVEYRRAVGEVLSRRALTAAWQRALTQTATPSPLPP